MTVLPTRTIQHNILPKRNNPRMVKNIVFKSPNHDMSYFNKNVRQCSLPVRETVTNEVGTMDRSVKFMTKEWKPLELVLEDDICEFVSRTVAYQIKTQVDAFDAKKAVSDYTFSIILDNTYLVKDCFFSVINYDDMDVLNGGKLNIALTIVYKDVEIIRD